MIPLTFAKFLKTAKPLAQSLYKKMTTGPTGNQYVKTDRGDARKELRGLIDDVINLGTKEKVILNDRKVSTFLGIPFNKNKSLANLLGSQARKGQSFSFPSLPNNTSVIRQSFDDLIDLDKPAIAYKNYVLDIAKKHNVSYSNVKNSLLGRTFKKDGVITRTMEPYENFTKYQKALRYASQPGASASLEKSQATLGDLVKLKNKSPKEVMGTLKNYTSTEFKIKKMFDKHIDQGGNKVEVLGDGSYLYGVGKNRKIYNNKSFEGLDIKKDPNFKEVYAMYRQQSKANAKKFIHPLTGKTASYKKIMEDAGLKGIDVDHAKTISVEPFTNLRLMDGRLNSAAGHITKFQKNPDAVTDLLKKDMYVEHGDDMLKKMGYDFSKDINKIQSDGISMAAKVLKYGKQYRTPGQISKESVGVTNRLEIGKEISKPNKAGKSYPIGMMKEGGRVQLKTGGRVYLAPGGKVYQPTSSSGNSRVGMFESILSGIGAGILDIPKGAFSLGASLMDLGAGTDTATDIEMWFDDLTTLDERAEATTAGKITRIMTNLGIPGTAAFKAGSRMARTAIEAKEAGTLYKFTKNTEGALEKTLTNKGRMLQTLGGVGGVGASDAIFVGDAERIGTLGDAFNIGITQLADNDENNAARTVMNRVKFGLDSAFLGGVIGGTGTAIKQAVQRSNNLNRNNDLIDKILEYTTPQGKKTKEFFEMERVMVGKRSADANGAQELQRQLDKEIDALYGQMGQKFGIGIQKERTALTKVVNDALVSSADGPKVTPVLSKEGLTEGATFTLGNMTVESLDALRKAKLKDPEEVIRILQRARRTMDRSFTDIASNVFRFGKSTKEAADDTLNRFAKFKTAFETKALDYVDDTYRIFGNKNSEALKGFKPTAEAVTNAKEMFKQLALKRTGKSISDEQAAYEVERILVSSKKQNKFLVEGEAVPLLQDETGFLKDIAIKDWTSPMLPLNKVAGEAGEDLLVNGLTPRKVIEDLFGKVQDPSATILSTLSDLSLVRRKHQFFGDFYDTMAGKQMFNTRREAAAVFGDNNVGEKAIQMLATNPGGKLNIEAVNPLNGRWSSKGIQEALEEVNSGWTTVLDKDNIFTTFYNNFVLYPKATSQLAKTVLSPVTHFRNLISATAFASANGIMPLMNKEALDEAMGAFSQVGARGSEAANKRYRELLRLGVVNKNARLGDLEDLLDDVDFGTTKFTNKVMQNLGKKLNKGKEYATDLYTAEDDFWKMFTFAAERSRIRKALEKSGIDLNVFAKSSDNDLGMAFKNGTEYLDEAAANIVRNNVPNYDYVSKFIKDLRKAPIGNFVSFPAEIIRTSINILGKGFKEFNYVDPLTKTKPFRSIGMQRMAGFGATAVAIPYGTVEAFKAAYNVSGLEMDALRRFVPDWSKNSTLVPIKDNDGNFTYIDFSHANAYDTMIRPFKTIMNAVADGRTDNDTVMEDLMQGVVESTTELGAPFISESIWTQALTDVFVRNGRTRDGRRLYTEQTPYGDRFSKGLFHLVEAQTPGSANTIKRMFNSIFDQPDKYGKRYDFTKEAAGIAGLRAVDINPVDTMKYKIADYRTGINNSRREFTSPLLKGGVVTPEQIVDRYKLANESLYQVQKNMTKDFYGAMILGAKEGDLKREFKDRVSNKALRGIIQGQFKPFIPSENIEKSFRDQARELGNNSPYARAKDTIRRLAAQYNKLKLFGDKLPDFNNPFAGENTVLSTEGITSRLPSLNLGLNSLGGSATNNTALTQAKGSKVFGPNDTVFGS